MPPVAVRILHPEPDPSPAPLSRWVADARGTLAERHRRAFLAAGADDVAIAGGPPDGRSFGGRLRDLIATRAPSGPGGLVVLGSGSIPLATPADLRAFVLAAAGDGPSARANNRYSADIVAISRVDMLPEVPDLPGDNALPRWLEEVAGYRVDDLRGRWRLAVDIDGPLDLVLLGAGSRAPVDLGVLRSRLACVRGVAGDRRGELLVAGRTSAATLAWLERNTAARVRAWVEERGLRGASGLALGGKGVVGPPGADSGGPGGRAPSSILGTLLERDGPGSLGDHLAGFADAAIIDTRVLLAHRLGAGERAWPVAEDRFASDLLHPEGIADPWLRALTASATVAPIPILLGGHTLVGPGVRLVVDGPPAGPRWR